MLYFERLVIRFARLDVFYTFRALNLSKNHLSFVTVHMEKDAREC